MRRSIDDFFQGATFEVAKRLIGALLVRRLPSHESDAGAVLAAKIVETEAYLPLVDPSCHGYRGPTPRNASIFGRAGFAYVYFIYGNHHCLNVTTEPAGIGAAVLIRAAEPLRGLSAMRRRRPGIPDAALLSGPGNLCRAMSIDRACDGANLRRGDLQIRPGKSPAPAIANTARIGIGVAERWPLRFIDPYSASLSPFGKRLNRDSQTADKYSTRNRSIR